MSIRFSINNISYTVSSDTVSIDTSLNRYIRDHAHLSGTKFMCLEGGCGVCVVNISGLHPVTEKWFSYAVNSCLLPVFSCHGLNITTIEGIGDKSSGYHPTQKVLAGFNGTQCGYCSPGMVMNMYSMMQHQQGRITMQQVEDAFSGNICRCTGYRPILDAFKSLAIDADSRLKNACKDIEDLAVVCTTPGTVCTNKCPSNKSTVQTNEIHLNFEDGKQWYKVYTISSIFAIFTKIADTPYILVTGNTAHGVYRSQENITVYIDISSVKELRTHSLDDNLVIGANVSLTEMVSILTYAAKTKSGFEYCLELIEHINLIGNVPVRNTGTIAGNLSIKNQHKEFLSDLYLILEAVGAKLTIAESTDRTIMVSPEEYIGINMKKKVILNIVLSPKDPKSHVVRSSKIMLRVQNCRAYINSAFAIKLDLNRTRVTSATICFGGINPKFTHATETEGYLTGTDIFTNNNLQTCLRILSNELQPNWTSSSASPEYRKHLAIALFYKFILSIAPKCNSTVKPLYQSGGAKLYRPISTAIQEFDSHQNFWPLTKCIPKIEALTQTSGEAKFTNDLPRMPNELFAAFVLATEVHAEIHNIDATDALNLPGVIAFYSARDIPGQNDFMPFKELEPDTEEIFCSSKVLYHGQPVGIVVAKTFALAEKASKLVKISYSLSDEPIYPTAREVFSCDHKNVRITNSDHGFTGKKYEDSVEGPLSVNGKLELGGQYHYSMETQTCICVPIEDGMDIYSSTQWVDLVQVAVARMLNVTESSLNLQVRRLGGSYGGKASRSSLIACACALAAFLTRRPIRLIMSLEANMSAIGKRYGLISEYEVSFSREGKIRKLYNRFVHDSGSSHNETPFYIKNSYPNCYVDNRWKIEALKAITDSASNTWCRAPGSTEAIAMIETIMEHVAHATNQDPTDVRMINMPKDSKMIELLPQFRSDVHYDERKRSIGQFNQQNRWKKRGISIVPMRYPVGYLGTLHALVSIYHGDGSVSIAHGGIEMGQGLNTKVAQVVAHILAIPIELISIKPANNLISPNAVCTQASFTSEAVCYAVKKACEILLQRIQPIREKNDIVSWAWQALITEAYKENINLCASYMYQANELQPYDVWGLSCAEVEVDILTGNVQINRVDILQDTGESLSPGIDIGQIEGAFVMGLGYYLTEELTYETQTGALLTNRSWNYKPPSSKDIPVDFRIRLLRNSSNSAGVLRSKTTGEPAIVMSVVVIFAIRHALMSARKDAGLANDWIELGAPTTPERIFQLAGNNLEQFKLT